MAGPCSIPGCERPSRALGMCEPHWHRQHRRKTPDQKPIRIPRWPGATPKARQIWDNIQKRCHTAPQMRQFKNYGGRGIENRITPYEIQALWERDGADLMKQPSIDRIDNDDHYTFANCRFIEHSENGRRGSINYWDTNQRDQMSARQAANYLKISIPLLTKLTKAGELPARKVNKHWVYSRVAFEDWFLGALPAREKAVA